MARPLTIPPNAQDLDQRQVRAYIESIRTSQNAIEIEGTAGQIAIAGGDFSAGLATIFMVDNPIIPGTDSMTVPTGTTGDRPTPVAGMMRYNTTTSKFEGYDGSNWVAGLLDEGLIDHDALTNYLANEHIDWTSTNSNFSTSGTLASGTATITGNITLSGTVDGRDVAADGTKLDTVETNADVTDAANVSSSLSAASLPAVSVATDDKVIIQDTSDSNNIKTVTTQSIANLFVQDRSTFRAYRSGSQTIANNTATKVQFNVAEFDTNSDYDATTNYRFTPSVAGYYQISASVLMNEHSSPAIYRIFIYQNGSEISRADYNFSNSNFGTMQINDLLFFSGFLDYVEIFVLQITGGNVTLQGTANWSWFSGHLVHPL